MVTLYPLSLCAGPDRPLPGGLPVYHVQSCGGALLLQGLQVFQVLLSLLLAMATLHRRLPEPQATHSDLQGSQPLRLAPPTQRGDDFVNESTNGIGVCTHLETDTVFLHKRRSPCRHGNVL